MKDDFSELKDIDVLKAEETAVYKEQRGNIVLGVVFILVGAAVLFSMTTGYTLHNWWALFMLIPAGKMSMELWQDYETNGRLTKKTSGLIIPITVLLTIISIFLFNLSWSIIWPASFIAVGVSILVGGGMPNGRCC